MPHLYALVTLGQAVRTSHNYFLISKSDVARVLFRAPITHLDVLCSMIDLKALCMAAFNLLCT